MVSSLSCFYGCFSVFKETLSGFPVPIIIFLGGGAPLRNGVTAEYQLYKKAACRLRGGGGGAAHPLQPLPRSAPGLHFWRSVYFLRSIGLQQHSRLRSLATFGMT